MEIILLPGNQPALSYASFEAYGISRKTVEYHVKAKPHAAHYEGGKCFVRVSCMTKAIIEKLPPKPVLVAECKHEGKKEQAETLETQLQTAWSSTHRKYVRYYLDTYKVPEQKAVEFARKRAGWELIAADIEAGNKNAMGRFEAWKNVFGSDRLSYASFNNMTSKLKKMGAEQMALDKRYQNQAPESLRATASQIAWVALLVADPRKLSGRQIFNEHREMSLLNGMEPMSEKWVELQKKELLSGNAFAYEQRHGTNKTNSKLLPSAKMKQAQHANTQWQIDGKVLAFVVGVGKKLKRFTLFTIVDAYSKMIVGYSIGESENKLLVMAAIRNAVTFTGCLPHEIVADNSSFQKTAEAAYFKQYLDDRGLHFTVTSNPRGKIVSERYNQYLDAECRMIPGFLGIGVTAHSDDAQIKEELVRQFYATPLTPEQLINIACFVVEKYNSTTLEKYRHSPVELYRGSDQPHAFPMDVFGNLKATLDYQPKLIRNGQIRFKIGMQEIWYKLPNTLFEKLNNKTVRVRYIDLSEKLYLYTDKKDEPIVELKPVQEIAAAKADQTERDKQLYYNNAAQLKAIKTNGRKAFEKKIVEAIAENSECIDQYNDFLLSKDTAQQIRENADLRKHIAIQGGNADAPAPAHKVKQLTMADIAPPKPKPSLVQPKGHQITKVNPYEEAKKYDLEDD